MKRNYTLFLLILLSSFIPKEVYAQCISSFTVTSKQDISCHGGNDGAITVELVGGTAPFRYILDIQSPYGDILVGEVVNTAEREVTFSLANGNVESFGIMAKNPIDGGDYLYRVRVLSSDGATLPGCNSRSMSGIVFSEPAAELAVSINATDATCNGGNDGEAIANPTGGTAPYTYEWNTSPVQTTQTATGLSIGTYTVTITDANGCTVDESVTIEQPTSLTLATSQIETTCSGTSDGEATVNATGGTGPYVYSWNTTPVQTTQTATGLSAGTYTVTVTDANGCFGTSDVTIAEPDLLVASMDNSTDASCNGAADGEATVSVTGGTAPYTYSWNTSPIQTSSTATGLVAGTYEVTIEDANGCSVTESVVIDEPEPLVVAIDNNTDATCNGGSDGTATASAAGGTGPYTYNWNTTPAQTSATATGLEAGVYTVTVTDANGCSETAAVTIDEPTPIVINIDAVQDASCYGESNGEATAIASGGVAPYTYTWNTSPVQNAATATGLAAGTYSVTIEDANGCSETASVTINEPDELVVMAISEDITCNGSTDGQIEVTVTGGTAGYEYSLNGGAFQAGNLFENLTAGTYTITVRDANGCTAIATATVDEPSALTAAVTSSDATCNGSSDGTVTVTAGGGTPDYEYSLDGTVFQSNNLFENLAAGTYTVTVRDASGCTVTAAATIGEPAELTATVVSDDATCNGGTDGTITVTAGGGTAGYEYSLDGTNFQVGNLFENLAAGAYAITVRDVNGCMVTATTTIGEPIELTVALTTTDASCNGGSEGAITVTTEGGIPGYEYSLNGGPFQTSNLFENLIAGAYTITVRDANGCTETASITINEPDELLAVAAAVDITCNGSADGQIEVTVAGGTAAYEYSLNGGAFQAGNLFENLAAGTYTITVRDANGCTATATATIDEPAALTAAITSADATCNGAADGTITVVAGGGTADYEYSLDGTNFQSNNLFENLAAGSYTVTVRDASGCTVTAAATIGEPAELTASVSTTDASCSSGSDGSITVAAGGGSPNYEYSLDGTTFQSNNIFENLAAGNYTITVRDDNGCTVTVAATVNAPAALTVSLSSIDATCHGSADGTIIVTAQNGTPGYEYSLDGTNFQSNNLFDDLAAGTYTVTVRDANGCTETASITINEPDELLAVAAAVDITCNGSADGQIEVTVTGGTTAYEYSLNGGAFQAGNLFENLAAGTYTITVRDANGCTATATATIGEPAALTAAITSADATCYGAADGTITVAAQDGTPGYEYSLDGTTFQSNNLFENLAAGTYTVTVRDASGCTVTAAATIGEPAGLTATVVSDDATCNGGTDGTITVTAGGGTADYEYSLDGTNFQSSNHFENLVAGAYTITVRDANGCTVTTTATVDGPDALIANATATDATCHGAADGTITVTAQDGTPGYEYSLDGTNFQSGNLFESLIAGNYTITVRDAGGCTVTTTATINEPDELVVTASSEDITCNGSTDGQIEVTVTGGSAAYEYSLNGGAFQAGNLFENLTAGAYAITVRDANGCTATATATIDEPAALAAAVTSTHATCYGAADGTITVAAQDGTPGYEYSLDGTTFQSSNLFENLASGIYTITVRDANGCTVTAAATIGEPAELNVAISTTETSCDGGSEGTITVTVGGGTPDYEYSLDGTIFQASNLFENLAAGAYTITVRDANGCTVTTTATVDGPDALIANATATDASCHGAADGTITVTAQDGTPGYEYALNGGTFQGSNLFENLAAGTYTITIRDAGGCTVTTTATINEPDELVATAVSTDITCNGSADGQIEVTVDGGTTAYEYSLNGGAFQAGNLFENLAAGAYTITVRDANGCTATATATIDEPGALAAAITSADATCNGASDGEATVNVTGGTAPYTYSWNTSPVQTDATVAGLAAGTYEVTITDVNGCTITESVTIEEPTPLLVTIDSQEDVSCNGGADGEATVTVAGGAGSYAYSWSTMPVQTTASATGLSAGTYTVTVTDENGCSETLDVTIAEPDVLTATVVTLPDCDGNGTGSIDLTVNGGIVPYIYTWSNGLPSQEDHDGTLASGTYSVIIEDANGCTITLNDIEVASQIIADAGSDQTICTDQAQLSAQPLKAGEIGEWSSVGNTATITNVNDPATTVTGLSVGTHVFIWSVKDVEDACGSQTDEVRIEVIGNLTQADAGEDQNICIDEATLAANAVGIGESGKWTVLSGSGNFLDDTDPTTQVSGLTAGLNQFVWTITDDNGTCPASEDIVEVYYIVVTEAVAGPDQSICTDVATLSANAVQTGEVGTWTVISGNGDFQDANNPETLVENLSVGVNEFSWTITDAANTCAATTDIVRIEVIGNLTVADAGEDQDVCVDEVTMAANAVAAGETGAWVLVSGAGQIDNANSATTLVTGLSLGDNEFEWRITDDNGICPDSFDRVIITYNPQATPPTVAITNYDYCIGETIVALEAIGTDIKWYDDEALTNEIGAGSSFTPTIDNTVAATHTFYVTQTATGCGESEAVEITVSISDSSPAPIVDVPLVQVCQNGGIPTLEATGTDLAWYADAALTVMVGAGNAYTPNATELDMTTVGTTVFYVTQNTGCGEGPAVEVSVEVTNVSSLPLVVTPGAFCLNSPQPTLVATGSNLAWYADAALTIQIGTGPSFTPDATVLDMSVAGTTVFYVTQDQGCGESAAVSVAVNVLDANDPACVGGGTGCGVFTQVFIDNVVNPSCNSSGIISQDGEFVFNVVGGNAPYTYKIESEEGIEEQFNNPYFDGLKAGTYLATVKDALGNECSITYTLLVESTLVGVASNLVDAVCYGSNSGQATITITEGGTTGFYSFDEGASWFPFTSGNPVTNLPPKGTYNLRIGNQPNDPCPGLVEVTINNQYDEIKVAGFNTVTPASCDNNDGEVQIGAITGGSGSYTFELNGAPYTMPDDFIIRSLERGEHRLSIIDENNCKPAEPFVFHVESPGLVLFEFNTTPASCGQEDGWAEVEITGGNPPYYYSIGKSSFQEVPSDKFILSGLAQGFYELTIQSGNSEEACPNVKTVYIPGYSMIDYEMDVTHIACYGDESGIVSFTNISGGEINLQVTGPNGYARSVSNVGYNREFRNLEPGVYTFTFVQIGECNSTRTEVVDIKQPRKLYAEIKDATISLPDIPTGSITVRVDQMSGTGPYVATAQRTYPTGDQFFYLQEDTVRMNPMNLQYELTFYDAPPGDYTVHVRDANGCDTTMTVLVDYDRSIFIPNVFTPNGDDANETFFVRNLPPEGAQMIITNRWGKVVYSNDNYDNTWDGGDLPDGIYYYKLILEEESFSGWVEIWRGSSR